MDDSKMWCISPKLYLFAIAASVNKFDDKSSIAFKERKSERIEKEKYDERGGSGKGAVVWKKVRRGGNVLSKYGDYLGMAKFRSQFYFGWSIVDDGEESLILFGKVAVPVVMY